ncbi:MAG: Na+/H+ antiporter subunit A, partial [Candidatus Marinamargulisbacteria bacterium]|nr:Na+/H+ antiporter subunit A [Candidatus Marinamargulisbacteria bacterium]
FVFFLYRAPDLVLTQLLIEIVSLVLLLLFFKKFSTMKRKKDHTVHDRSGLSFLKALVSIGVGGIVFVLIQVVNRPSADNPIGQFFIENTRPLAGGSNAVNTILVDFRGFDTLGEISVLFIAMVGVMGLLWNKRS